MSTATERENKRKIGIRLSREAQVLRERLAARLGVPMASVIEMAIRKLAEAEGVSAD